MMGQGDRVIVRVWVGDGGQVPCADWNGPFYKKEGFTVMMDVLTWMEEEGHSVKWPFNER